LTVGDGTARLWPVPRPIKGDPQRITLWAEVLSGVELDDHGSGRVLDAATWRERKQELETLGGPPRGGATAVDRAVQSAHMVTTGTAKGRPRNESDARGNRGSARGPGVLVRRARELHRRPCRVRALPAPREGQVLLARAFHGRGQRAPL